MFGTPRKFDGKISLQKTPLTSRSMSATEGNPFSAAVKGANSPQRPSTGSENIDPKLNSGFKPPAGFKTPSAKPRAQLAKTPATARSAAKIPQTPQSASQSLLKGREARQAQEKRTQQEIAALREGRRAEKAARLAAAEADRLRRLEEVRARNAASAAARKRELDHQEAERRRRAAAAAADAARRCAEQKELRERLRAAERARRRRSLGLRAHELESHQQWKKEAKESEKESEQTLLETRKLNHEDDALLRQRARRRARESLAVRGQVARDLRERRAAAAQREAEAAEGDRALEKAAWQDTKEYEEKLKRDRRQSLMHRGIKKKAERKFQLQKLEEERAEDTELLETRRLNLEDDAAARDAERQRRRESTAARGALQGLHRELGREQRERERLAAVAECEARREGLEDAAAHRAALARRRRESTAWHAAQATRLRQLREGEAREAREAQTQELALRADVDREALLAHLEEENARARASLAHRKCQVDAGRAARAAAGGDRAVDPRSAEERGKAQADWEDARRAEEAAAAAARLSLGRRADEQRRLRALREAGEQREADAAREEVGVRAQEREDVEAAAAAGRRRARASLLARAQEFRRCRELGREIAAARAAAAADGRALAAEDRAAVLNHMEKENELRKQELMLEKEAFFSAKEYAEAAAAADRERAAADRALAAGARADVAEHARAQEEERRTELEMRAQCALFNRLYERDAAAFRAELGQHERALSEQDRADVAAYLAEQAAARRASLLARAEEQRRARGLRRAGEARRRQEDLASTRTLVDGDAAAAAAGGGVPVSSGAAREAAAPSGAGAGAGLEMELQSVGTSAGGGGIDSPCEARRQLYGQENSCSPKPLAVGAAFGEFDDDGTLREGNGESGHPDSTSGVSNDSMVLPPSSPAGMPPPAPETESAALPPPSPPAHTPAKAPASVGTPGVSALPSTPSSLLSPLPDLVARLNRDLVQADLASSAAVVAAAAAAAAAEPPASPVQSPISVGHEEVVELEEQMESLEVAASPTTCFKNEEGEEVDDAGQSMDLGVIPAGARGDDEREGNQQQPELPLEKTVVVTHGEEEEAVQEETSYETVAPEDGSELVPPATKSDNLGTPLQEDFTTTTVDMISGLVAELISGVVA